ncbi:MAG: hypothetical protein EOO12_00160 [Chitinophagaceae bacterium]|nr:MAG: hypothetical protein EOO12_00160 [Chitinophagaceae bacterium]
MPKNSVSEWSTTAASNTDVGGVDLGENTMRPRDVNNAIRTMMAQIKTVLGGNTTTREKLTAARTYYVRTDGSNSNTGLANTSGGAFLTAQKAMDVIADTLDIGNYDVTVSIGDGTYTGTLRLKTFIGSAGRVKFVGNTTTPANVLFSTTSTTAVATNDNGVAGVFELRGFKVQTTTSGDGINISAPRAIVYIGNIDFGACAGTQMNASFGSLVYYLASLAVSGNAVLGFVADREATMFLSAGTIVYSNSPVYSARNFQFSGGGTLDVYSMTFTNGGTVTGKRYEGDGLGRCFTNGGGASYVPGNSAGSVANGAVYY